MHPAIEALPSRVQHIVLQEIAAGIVWVGAQYSNVDAIFSARGSKFTSHVRDAIWWRCREELTVHGGGKVSFTQIARWFNRDHTSVMAGVKRHPRQMVDWSEAKQKFYQMQRRDQLEWAVQSNDHIRQQQEKIKAAAAA